MKIFTIVMLWFAACVQAYAQQSVWVPKAEFRLEKNSLTETMFFVSGMSYALTEYSKTLEKKRKSPVFCIPGRGVVMSSMIFDILNARYSGQIITAEQATTSAMVGLQERYPCK